MRRTHETRPVLEFRWEDEMRKKLPDLGALRRRSGFLWLPKTIGGERRWLEWTRWEQEYWAWGIRMDSCVRTGGYWRDSEWVDD
jgi:hypothetical protein